jgi:site-specific recombinase XerD
VRRLRSGVLGGVLDDFVGDMLARGHAGRTFTADVREAARLAGWMERQGRTVDTLSRSILEEFLVADGGATRSGNVRRHARAALRRLLVTLDGKGMVAPASSSAPSPGDALVRQFLEHSTRCRGLSTATCQQQGRLVREFITARFPVGAVDVGLITAHDLMGFVTARAEQGHTRSAKSTVSALRAFLRFLVLRGLCTDELVRAVPTVVHRGARLPRALTDEQVHRLLTLFDRSRPVGRRDHAIAHALRAYEGRRDGYKRQPRTDRFFASEYGTSLKYSKVITTFVELRRRLGWKVGRGGRLPRLHDMRHTFAVRRLLRWYEEGVDVNCKIASLSTYLGHVKVSDTYWYLTGVPELLAVAAARFEQLVVRADREAGR